MFLMTGWGNALVKRLFLVATNAVMLATVIPIVLMTPVIFCLSNAPIVQKNMRGAALLNVLILINCQKRSEWRDGKRKPSTAPNLGKAVTKLTTRETNSKKSHPGFARMALS